MSDAFKPFVDEGMAALKDVGKKLGQDAKWFLDAMNDIHGDAQRLTHAMSLPETTPEKRAACAEMLRDLIPARRKFILAAAEAELGSRAKAILEVALDLGARFFAAAVVHFLKL